MFLSGISFSWMMPIGCPAVFACCDYGLPQRDIAFHHFPLWRMSRLVALRIAKVALEQEWCQRGG